MFFPMWSRDQRLSSIQTSAHRTLPQRGPPGQFYPILFSLSLLSHCFIFPHSSHRLLALYILLLIYHVSSSPKCNLHGERLGTIPWLSLVPTQCSWWVLSTICWMKEKNIPEILPPSEPLWSHHFWLRENIHEGQRVGMERKLSRREENLTLPLASWALSLWEMTPPPWNSFSSL